MAWYSNALTEVFESYGDDAEAALQAYANVDPQGWHAYTDAAVAKQYLADYRNWARSLVRSVDKERLVVASGQARLFEPSESGAGVILRERLVIDGAQHELVGLVDTKVIRRVAQRDLAPAKTTIDRCRRLFELADHMDAEAERLGRPVSAGEVLGWAA